MIFFNNIQKLTKIFCSYFHALLSRLLNFHPVLGPCPNFDQHINKGHVLDGANTMPKMRACTLTHCSPHSKPWYGEILYAQIAHKPGVHIIYIDAQLICYISNLIVIDFFSIYLNRYYLAEAEFCLILRRLCQMKIKQNEAETKQITDIGVSDKINIIFK